MPDPIPFRGSPKNPSDDAAHTSDPPLTQDDRVYTSEEVSEVIRIALGKAEHLDRDTVNHEELLSVARDFGLREADIDQAFQQITRSRVFDDHAEKAALKFKLHALCFLIVNVGLFLINALSDPSFWWVAYPAVSWGTLLLLHFVAMKYVPALPDWILERVIGAAQLSSEHASARHGGTVPARFVIDDLYGSMATAKGIAEVGVFCLEYQISDIFFGGIRSKVRKVTIPLEYIASAHLERRLWYNRLVVQGTRMKVFSDVPGNAGGEIKLRFTGAARSASERLLRMLNAGKN